MVLFIWTRRLFIKKHSHGCFIAHLDKIINAHMHEANYNTLASTCGNSTACLVTNRKPVAPPPPFPPSHPT